MTEENEPVATEAEMREQMFDTMVALELAAKAALLYFTSKTTVPEAKEPEPPPKPAPKPLNTMPQLTDTAKQRRAIALIAKFAEFKDTSFGMLKAREKIANLIGMEACHCVGTGWLARDETCKDCKGQGYL